jgi:hypothetical protein
MDNHRLFSYAWGITIISFGNAVRRRQPVPVTTTVSSIRTPPQPGM